jgi:hypothetical protein
MPPSLYYICACVYSPVPYYSKAIRTSWSSFSSLHTHTHTSARRRTRTHTRYGFFFIIISKCNVHKHTTSERRRVRAIYSRRNFQRFVSRASTRRILMCVFTEFPCGANNTFAASRNNNNKKPSVYVMTLFRKTKKKKRKKSLTFYYLQQSRPSRRFNSVFVSCIIIYIYMYIISVDIRLCQTVLPYTMRAASLSWYFTYNNIIHVYPSAVVYALHASLDLRSVFFFSIYVCSVRVLRHYHRISLLVFLNSNCLCGLSIHCSE